MEQTLLDLLADSSSDALVELTLQYRMNEEIMLLPNQLIYNNRLKCGSEYVRTDTVKYSTNSTVSLLVCVYVWRVYIIRLDCEELSALFIRD